MDISYKVKTIVLADYYTLMDVAYIYTWKRVSKQDKLPHSPSHANLFICPTSAHMFAFHYDTN